MDPDSGGNFYNSAIFKASVLTISFSTIYYYRTEKTMIFPKYKPPKADTAAVVVSKKEPAKPARKKKTIYLTFDDGPNKGTRALMHIIEQEKVPVTLFVVGEHVYGSRYQSAIYDSVSMNQLFEIANHSYSHGFNNKFETFYSLPDSASKDFLRCADSLHLVSNIIRTPGRNIWRTDSVTYTDLKKSTVAADSFYRKGLVAIGWDLEWHFNRQQRLVQNTEELLKQVDSVFSNNKTKTADHLVLLAHDQVYANADDSASLQNFIVMLKNRDEYNFETVSRYPGAKKQ